MVLLLAIHSVPSVTAKVPFSMVLLSEQVRKQNLGQDMKCRMLMPTSGLRSVSLWDICGDDAEQTLHTWLDEYLDVECSNEIFEVQEEFALGFMEQLNRTRAAEKVSARAREASTEAAAASKRLSENVRQQVTDVDQKLKISETTSAAIKNAQQKVNPVLARVNMSAKQQYDKAMQNRQVAAAAASVQGGLQQMSKNLGLGWNMFNTKVAEGLAQQPSGSHAEAGTAEALGAAASGRRPAAGSGAAEAPVQSAPSAQTMHAAGSQQQQQPQMQHGEQGSIADEHEKTHGSMFTLDDLDQETPKATVNQK